MFLLLLNLKSSFVFQLSQYTIERWESTRKVKNWRKSNLRMDDGFNVLVSKSWGKSLSYCRLVGSSSAYLSCLFGCCISIRSWADGVQGGGGYGYGYGEAVSWWCHPGTAKGSQSSFKLTLSAHVTFFLSAAVLPVLAHNDGACQHTLSGGNKVTSRLSSSLFLQMFLVSRLRF